MTEDNTHRVLGVVRSRTTERIALLYATAATEREVIARLSSCVADLNAARAAKQELANLSAAELRSALRCRRRNRREAQ